MMMMSEFEITVMTTAHYNQLVEDANRGNPFAVRCAVLVSSFIENFSNNRVLCFGCGGKILKLDEVGAIGLVHPVGGIEGTAFVGAMCACMTTFTPDQCVAKLRETVGDQFHVNLTEGGRIQ